MSYQLLLTNINNQPIADSPYLDTYELLEYSLKEGGYGVCHLVIPGIYNSTLYPIDGRIYIFRSVGDGPFYLEGDTCFFIRKYRDYDDEDGLAQTELWAYSANYLLDGRTVAYNSTTTYSSKSDFADDMMKEIVRENFSSSATDTSRQLSTSLFDIQADTSAGPTIIKSFARRNILEVLREISESSIVAGTWIGFDTVISNIASGLLEFRTYKSQRGVDHRWPTSTAPLLIGAEYGNLANASLTKDHSEERNYAYAGGQGEGTLRNVQVSSDSVRINISPFNRRELFKNASFITTPSGLIDEADQMIREHRPRTIFTGDIVDTPAVAYGREYNFGDLVTASFRGQTYDCRIDSISVRVSKGKETIKAGIRYEDD